MNNLVSPKEELKNLMFVEVHILVHVFSYGSVIALLIGWSKSLFTCEC